MADGRIPSLRTRYLSVVSALAAALRQIDLDAADYRLDGERHPHVHGLASSRGWTTMDTSGLGGAA